MDKWKHRENMINGNGKWKKWKTENMENVTLETLETWKMKQWKNGALEKWKHGNIGKMET